MGGGDRREDVPELKAVKASLCSLRLESLGEPAKGGASGFPLQLRKAQELLVPELLAVCFCSGKSLPELRNHVAVRANAGSQRFS
jgi:hypothetical protein